MHVLKKVLLSLALIISVPAVARVSWWLFNIDDDSRVYTAVLVVIWIAAVSLQALDQPDGQRRYEKAPPTSDVGRRRTSRDWERNHYPALRPVLWTLYMVVFWMVLWPIVFGHI